ncbi:hypothetical protein FFK22_038245 [Mycobacterium sp. KBS0706]|uniref:hypothetical protein n=1 Tax=Mycobacterium sp. KBS0706 TaxID=2578109 RepID=UPI00110FC6DA|nr:hypothetical protein [Mycobacterium sp. KBS0706]TSD83350.1 hypothetical protein FFK22_038245 [Mycobacterium sp. KBS0706]
MSGRTPSALPDIPGGAALIEWFGFVPNFHDGLVLATRLASDGPGEIRIHTWRITNRTDERGYFILDKHTVVTFSLEDIRAVNFRNFNEPTAIHRLFLTTVEDGFEIRWDNVCGAGGPGIEGSVTARRVSVSFVPGEPANDGGAEAGPSN